MATKKKSTRKPGRQAVLRAEAQLGLELTDEQNEAKETLLGLIQHGLELSSESYTLRRSRLAFLSAGRGMGKTTVMLALREEIREQPVEWLDPIDLDPVSVTANFLASLLARVDAAVSHRHGKARAGQGYAGGSDAVVLRHDRLQKLRDLSDRVAYTWGQVDSARSARLEPDQFSCEVMDHERHRLAFNEKLNGALQEALQEIRQQPTADMPGLFVLPIDDFDLDPELAMSLLKFLRQVSVPRLFVLVLGDVDILYRLVTDGLRNRTDGKEEGARESGANVRGVDREIAANGLRKMLPISQVVELRTPTRSKALAMSWSPNGSKQTLRGRLNNMKFEGNPKEGLGDVLAKASRAGRGDSDTELSTYQGADMLGVSLRHIYDLWLKAPETDASDRSTGSRDGTGIAGSDVEWFVRMIQQRAYEDGSLSYEARTLLEGLLRGVKERGEFVHGDWLTAETKLGARFTLTRDRNDELIRLRCSSVLRRLDGLTLRVRPEDGGASSTGVPITNTLAAALIVLHDLLRDGHGHVVGAWEDVHLAERAYTEWHTGRSGLVRVPWFSDVWRSVRTFDEFRWRWNAVQDAARTTQSRVFAADDEHRLLWTAKAWIWASVKALGAAAPGLAADEQWVLPVDEHSPDLSWLKGQVEPLVDSIQKVVKELARLESQNQRDVQHGLFRRWLINLICFISPECGIPWGLDSASQTDKDLPTRVIDAVQDATTGKPDAYERKLAPLSKGIAAAVRRERAARMGPHVATWFGVAMLNPRCLLSGNSTDILNRSLGVTPALHPNLGTRVNGAPPTVNGLDLAGLLGRDGLLSSTGAGRALNLLTKSVNARTLKTTDNAPTLDSEYSLCPSVHDLIAAILRAQRDDSEFSRKVDAAEAQEVLGYLESLRATEGAPTDPPT